MDKGGAREGREPLFRGGRLKRRKLTTGSTFVKELERNFLNNSRTPNGRTIVLTHYNSTSDD